MFDPTTVPDPVAIVGTHEAKAPLAVMQPADAGAEIALDPPVTHRVPVARLDALDFGGLSQGAILATLTPGNVD